MLVTCTTDAVQARRPERFELTTASSFGVGAVENPPDTALLPGGQVAVALPIVPWAAATVVVSVLVLILPVGGR